MRAFSLATLLGMLCACFALVEASQAEACAVDGDVDVTFTIHALARHAPAGDVTASYWLSSYPDDVVFDDENDKNGDEDEGENGDENENGDEVDNDPPDANRDSGVIHGELQVPFGDAIAHTMPAGVGEMVLEADGFEPVVIDRDFCGTAEIRATMLPEGESTLTVVLVRRDGTTPAKNAKVTIRGLSQRMGAVQTAYADEQGRVTIENVLPGFYDFSAWLPLGDSHEFLDFSDVDLLGDTQISGRLLASSDKPDVTTSCAAAQQGATPWMSLGGGLIMLMVMAQMLVTRRRYG